MRGSETLHSNPRVRTNSATQATGMRSNAISNPKQTRSNSIRSSETIPVTGTDPNLTYTTERLDSHKARKAFFDRLRTAEETIHPNSRMINQNSDFNGRPVIRLDLMNDSFTSDDDSFSDDGGEHIIYNRANTTGTATTANSSQQQFFFTNDTSSNYFIEKHEQLNAHNINQHQSSQQQQHTHTKLQNNWQRNVSLLYSEKTRPFLISAASKLISNNNNSNTHGNQPASNAKPYDVKTNFANVMHIDKKFHRKSARNSAATHTNSPASNQDANGNTDEIYKIEKELKRPIELGINERPPLNNADTAVPSQNIPTTDNQQNVSAKSPDPSPSNGSLDLLASTPTGKPEKSKSSRVVFTPPLITNIQLNAMGEQDKQRPLAIHQLSNNTAATNKSAVQTDVVTTTAPNIYQQMQLLQQPILERSMVTQPLLMSNQSHDNKLSTVHKQHNMELQPANPVINESMFLNKVTLNAQKVHQPFSGPPSQPTIVLNNSPQPTVISSHPHAHANLTYLATPNMTMEVKTESDKPSMTVQQKPPVKPSDSIQNANIMKANISNLLFRRQNLNDLNSQSKSEIDIKTDSSQGVDKPLATQKPQVQTTNPKLVTSFSSTQIKYSNELRNEINAYVTNSIASKPIKPEIKTLNANDHDENITHDHQKAEKNMFMLPVEPLAAKPNSDPLTIANQATPIIHKKNENEKLLWKRTKKKP